MPFEIKEAAKNAELVLFIGAGVSKLVGLPSWAELAGVEHFFDCPECHFFFFSPKAYQIARRAQLPF